MTGRSDAVTVLYLEHSHKSQCQSTSHHDDDDVYDDDDDDDDDDDCDGVK